MVRTALELRKESERTGSTLLLFILLTQLTSFLKEHCLDGLGSWLYCGVVVLFQLLSVLVPYLFLVHGKDNCMQGYGKLGKAEAYLIIPLFFAVFFLYYSAGIVNSSLFSDTAGYLTEDLELPGNKYESVLFFVSYVILSAVLEELYFRKAMISVLRPYGKWFAVTMSSLLFSVSHWKVSRVIPVFVSAFFLGLSYYETDNLSVPTSVHLLNNLFAFLTILISSKIGPEVAYSAVLAVVVVGFLSLIVLIMVLPMGKIFSSEDSLTADGKQFFTWPVITAVIVYTAILIDSCGVFR